MRLPVPFIQLPLSFDAGLLAAEIEALGEGVWRDHPQKFPGNSMLPLLAAGGDPGNESFVGEMQPTPELRACPYLMQVMASFGAVLGRCRLMRLAGQAEVTAHVDEGYYWVERVRIHVPIVTQPTVRFECGDATVNMAAGECWIFDTWREHNVHNDASLQRIHLVADTVGGEAFWSLVEQGRPHDARIAGWSPRLLVPTDARPALVCEHYNIPQVMSPWELQFHVQTLNAELVEAGTSDIQRMRQASVRLFRAWRGLWARFGDSGEGIDEYRSVLQRFIDQLPEAASQKRLRNGSFWFHALTSAVLKPAVRST
ncbi:MAG: aspartyl/asparaginyl beta-hydroxylase domain-containing protein [Xanthomonadales bacterium]|nr:aspartyl/asparaginyl beta-hydroxylase domain-containing protein [Xanthomonadales bacterium]